MTGKPDLYNYSNSTCKSVGRQCVEDNYELTLGEKRNIRLYYYGHKT